MVIKYYGPNDKTGVRMPPYTAADRHWAKMRSTVNHGGPIFTVGPAPRTTGPAAAATNRHNPTTSQSAQGVVVPEVEPSPQPDKA